jgi:hypothetical protein
MDWNNIFNEFIIRKLRDNEQNVQWFQLSRNPLINITILRAFKDKPWNWRLLSRKLYITKDILDENCDLPWDWPSISYNTSLSWDIVKQY